MNTARWHQLALGLGLGLAALATFAPGPAQAQPAPRYYAPERLWELPYNDQVRVISSEYADQSGGRRIPDDQLRFYLDQVRQSRWTFSQVRNDIAQSLGSSGGNGAGWNNGRQISCESRKNDAERCRTPWRNPARLVRQLSGTRCVEGQNWSSEPGMITVWKGCRAVFEEAPYTANRTVRCDSKSGDANRCPVPWRGPSRLVRQFSDTTCVEGRNWGNEPGLVVVWKGCRGEFAPAFGNGNGSGWNGNYSVSCSSSGNRRTTCAWDSRYGWPQLNQQLSGVRCIEGQTWGYDQRYGLWVDRGCRATFVPRRAW